jgi:hypothetical protein
MVERPTGAWLIAQERLRQLEVEHYTFSHDNQHTDAELVRAAACLAAPYELFANPVGSIYMEVWPWRGTMKKPERGGEDLELRHALYRQACDPDDIDVRVRELSKAGALVAAEIDRLERLRAFRVAGQGLLHADHLREPPR